MSYIDSDVQKLLASTAKNIDLLFEYQLTIGIRELSDSIVYKSARL